ncbi:chromosome segregation protein SMC [Paenibacillus yanchengensis]|uniref:Chromosome partition protein Smc n=1 Tax=Paenibacillus yanchengensis TaxID=2035833 RepID=A0ABW4YM87_9BACL
MYLKRIELAGFKSFADKTELEFVNGITAVVGPNGSGKSNISDGIRWVLGEQSAKSLRGGKMEDVIFAGSDARKAVNYSEVSLTLNNEDNTLPLEYNEVTVTRRVHRSGESEYLINKQPCRLKDITELFMDTGIGKEAYSIIGQGRIEEILSTRSEDRRGIFEEASGIVKYKMRKKEAQKKLDETEQNLLRIHDLIYELEDQIDPLAKQAEKATKFKTWREELKAKEISMYVYQIEQVHTAWTKASEQLQSLEHEKLQLATVVSKHDALLESDRQNLRNIELELDQLHELMLQVSEDVERTEGYGEVLKERQRNLQHNKTQLEQNIILQDEKIVSLAKEETEWRGKAWKLELELEQLQKQLLEEQERLVGVAESIAMEKQEVLKSELLEVLSTIAAHRNEIRYVNQQEEMSQRRQERLKEDEVKWLEQQAKLQEKQTELQEHIAHLLQKMEQLREQTFAANEKLQLLHDNSEQAEQTLRKWEQQRDSFVSRRDTMQEMQEALDGFMHGVKEVLKAARRSNSGLTGVHGAVAELIQVPEKMETAIETALGGALQHIVMDSEQSSRQAIQFLKQRQLGRATFLPMDVIKSRSLSDMDRQQLEALPGFIGIAAELIQSEAKYKDIVFNLLGNVLIAESLEAANQIAAKLKYRYRVVTVGGDIVNAGGSMTGGSLHKKGASLLGRQRQIDQLEQQIAAAHTTIEKLNHSRADLRKEQSIQKQMIDQLREEAEQARFAEKEAGSELAQIANEFQQLAEFLEIAGADQQVQQQELTELKLSSERAVEQLALLEQREQTLQEQIQQAEQMRKISEAQKEQLQSQLTELKIAVAKIDQERLNFIDQAARMQNEIRTAKHELAVMKEQLTKQVTELEEHANETVSQQEKLNQLRLKKMQCAERTDFIRADRIKLLTALDQGESETKEQREQLSAVEDKLRQTEISSNRLDVELDNLLRKLSEEYELSIELAKERYMLPEHIDTIEHEVRSLKRQIAALGEVNLGAIDEYERVKERFQFLTEQSDDLIEAKTTLYQVISEMDEEMSKRFRTTFEAIRSHFIVVFSKLFGGGRADLVMVEPANVLDTGIDIVAQPPGKKLQNLQLLSGGERALTAIALLFAILHVKPVPFCVLDEVEAALDEANVVRFAQYLREFSELTQFIVVTHRKGTMEEADVLYGITMEEGGVSKLVSVRLEEGHDEETA